MTTEVKKANNTLIKKEKTEGKNILDLIKSSEKQFSLALPKHFNSERFTRIAITTIRMNKDLAKCNQESLLGALMTLAQLGLEPGVLGQAYLIPFKNNRLGTFECQLQIGYKGLIELLRRSGQLSDIYAYTVYANDEFDIIYGLERNLIHKPNFKEDRGEIIGFYSVALLKDNTKAFEFMTKEQVIEHEEKYRKGSYKNKVWNDNFIEMAQKTVVKKMLKFLPVSVELLEKVNNDNGIIKVENIDNLQETNLNFDHLEETEAEMLVSNDQLLELLKFANDTGIDIKKKASEMKIDIDNMTEDELNILNDFISEKVFTDK